MNPKLVRFLTAAFPCGMLSAAPPFAADGYLMETGKEPLKIELLAADHDKVLYRQPGVPEGAKDLPLPESLLLPPRREKVDDVVALRTRTLTVVLDRLEDTFNMEAVLRICESMGLQDVHVIEYPDAPFEPHARELGSERELEGVRAILADGNGADRQLRVFNANRDIVEVVREIAAASEVAA